MNGRIKIICLLVLLLPLFSGTNAWTMEFVAKSVASAALVKTITQAVPILKRLAIETAASGIKKYVKGTLVMPPFRKLARKATLELGTLAGHSALDVGKYGIVNVGISYVVWQKRDKLNGWLDECKYWFEDAKQAVLENKEALKDLLRDKFGYDHYGYGFY